MAPTWAGGRGNSDVTPTTPKNVLYSPQAITVHNLLGNDSPQLGAGMQMKDHLSIVSVCVYVRKATWRVDRRHIGVQWTDVFTASRCRAGLRLDADNVWL